MLLFGFSRGIFRGSFDARKKKRVDGCGRNFLRIFKISKKSVVTYVGSTWPMSSYSAHPGVLVQPGIKSLHKWRSKNVQVFTKKILRCVKSTRDDYVSSWARTSRARFRSFSEKLCRPCNETFAQKFYDSRPWARSHKLFHSEIKKRYFIFPAPYRVDADGGEKKFFM